MSFNIDLPLITCCVKAIHAVNAVLWHPGKQTHNIYTNKQTYTRGRPFVSRVIRTILCTGKYGVLSEPVVPLTQDEADALQKLLEGAQVTIGHPIVAGTTTLKEVQQLLTQRGLVDMAANLRTELYQSKHPKLME